MNLLGMLYVLIGVLFLIYSILWRDKVNYYSRKYRKTSEMTILNSSEFLRLQLKYSIFNSIFLIIFGMVIIIFNLNSVFVVAGFLPFHFINFLLIMDSKKKGFIDYKVGETYK